MLPNLQLYDVPVNHCSLPIILYGLSWFSKYVFFLHLYYSKFTMKYGEGQTLAIKHNNKKGDLEHKADAISMHRHVWKLSGK